MYTLHSYFLIDQLAFPTLLRASLDPSKVNFRESFGHEYHPVTSVKALREEDEH